MSDAIPTGSTAGRLLVATPVINDPNFDGTVVLMLQHDDTDGAVGIVINRPTDTEVVEILPEWGGLVGTPPVVFSGGPVSVGSAIALGGTTPATSPPGWTRVVHDIGTVDLERPVDEIAPHMTTARLYAGYSGWGPGQLEDEIDAGAWFVVDAFPDDALTADPAELWSRVLRRQPGNRSWFANYPVDPSFN